MADLPVTQPAACPAIRVVMMPRDTNPNGTIFGGIILSYIDQAGAIEFRKHSRYKCVTVAMDGVVFKHPVFVGDVLSFYTSVVSFGRTSIKVKVHVDAERFGEPGIVVSVTEATLVFVAIDDELRPTPIRPAHP